ncbi:MAG: hypothetical protein QGG71_22805 [Pirellulaceae bacterium]|nr:hypothetical protein [Pirellulaceae bacterium]
MATDKHVPIWVIHKDADKVVPVDHSRKITQALKDGGGDPKYTECPGVGHDSWTQTYANPATFSWLFQQERMN